MSESRLTEMAFAGKRYGVRRAAELCCEDPSRFAEQIVGLFRGEADATEAEFRRLRDLGCGWFSVGRFLRMVPWNGGSTSRASGRCSVGAAIIGGASIWTGSIGGIRRRRPAPAAA